jgi:hypothetical protein
MRLLLIPALLLSTLSFAAEAETAKPKPYPLDVCAISGEKLDDMGGAVVKVYNGQEVKFCCGGCVKKFEKDIDGNLAKLQKQAQDAKAAPVAK